MAYPKTMYKVVNSLDEESEAVEFGCTFSENEPAKQEYPRMLYKHPEDKTQEHKFVVVNNEDEHKQAEGNGYQIDPHVPETEEQTGYAQETPTDNPEVISRQQESPAEIIQDETGVVPEDQHLEEKEQE